MPAAARRGNHRVYNRFYNIQKLGLLFQAQELQSEKWPKRDRFGRVSRCPQRWLQSFGTHHTPGGWRIRMATPKTE